MESNVNNYSLGGSLELGANVAFGFNSSASSNPFVSAVTGNGVGSLLFGNGVDAAGTMATSTPDVVNAGIGSALTYGRRSSNIMSLNLAGHGGLPTALSSASSGISSFLSSVSSALNFGMEAGTRWAVDATLTAAEAIGCSIPRGY